MIKNILADYTRLMEKEVKTWDRYPKLAECDIVSFNSTKSCEICGFTFSLDKQDKQNRPVRHHRWDKKTYKLNSQGVYEPSNYIAALRSPYNLKISLKLNYMSVQAHNATRYDIYFILNAINDELTVVDMLSKSGENFIKISIKKNLVKMIHLPNGMGYVLKILTTSLVVVQIN